MVKNVIVTFEYNSETDTVSKVQCSVDGVEKKTRTTRKKNDVIEEMAKEPIITLEPTKLLFNNKAVLDMEIEYQDRIVIKWEKENNTLFPIIGKDVSFDEEGNGNKITKTNNILYKGKQNAILAEFGTEFTIEPYKDKIWKLVSNTNPSFVKTLQETIEVVKKTNPILLVDNTDDDKPIDEIQFTI